MKLDGFRLIGSEPVMGSATITVKDDTIKMNKALGLEMQSPKYLQFLLNAETKQLAVRGCEKDAPNCRPLCSADMKEKQITRRINTVVSSAIRSCMGWSAEMSMSIGGTYMPAERIMLFDLEKGHPVRNYSRKGKEEEE